MLCISSKGLKHGCSLLQRDSTQKHVKNLDVVLGADTAVLILDDTEGVWPQHAANLIQVDRYIFFPACATRFGRSHKCLLERGQDEDADKGMLSTALQVLQQVHTTLFQVMLCLHKIAGIKVSQLQHQWCGGGSRIITKLQLGLQSYCQCVAWTKDLEANELLLISHV